MTRSFKQSVGDDENSGKEAEASQRSEQLCYMIVAFKEIA